jgi:hypothetical protein
MCPSESHMWYLHVFILYLTYRIKQTCVTSIQMFSYNILIFLIYTFKLKNIFINLWFQTLAWLKINTCMKKIEINFICKCSEKVCIYTDILYTILGEYVKNLCLTSDKTCIPCPGRLPSCRGLSDGLHSFPGRLWMEDYIKCFRNRTMDVSKCPTGYFNPTLRACTTQLGRSKFKL